MKYEVTKECFFHDQLLQPGATVDADPGLKYSFLKPMAPVEVPAAVAPKAPGKKGSKLTAENEDGNDSNTDNP